MKVYVGRKVFGVPLVIGIICLCGIFVNPTCILPAIICLIIGFWPTITNKYHNSQAAKAQAEYEATQPNKYKCSVADIDMKAFMSLKEKNDDYALTKAELKEEEYTDDKIYQYDFNLDPFFKEDGDIVYVYHEGYDDNILIGRISDEDHDQVAEIIHSDKYDGVYANVTGGKYKLLLEDYNDDTDKVTYTYETGEDPYEIALTLESRKE